MNARKDKEKEIQTKSKERENELMKDRTNQTIRRLHGIESRHRQASVKHMEQALALCPNSINQSAL